MHSLSDRSREILFKSAVQIELEIALVKQLTYSFLQGQSQIASLNRWRDLSLRFLFSLVSFPLSLSACFFCIVPYNFFQYITLCRYALVRTKCVCIKFVFLRLLLTLMQVQLVRMVIRNIRITIHVLYIYFMHHNKCINPQHLP